MISTSMMGMAGNMASTCGKERLLGNARNVVYNLFTWVHIGDTLNIFDIFKLQRNMPQCY